MNTNDKYTSRELLQHAAKAAGVEGTVTDAGISWRGNLNGGFVMETWNPLKNANQAIELAAKLNMKIIFTDRGLLVQFGNYSGLDNTNGDPVSALCRSIVRAAAHLAE
jgi:hypothetical protein